MGSAAHFIFISLLVPWPQGPDAGSLPPQIEIRLQGLRPRWAGDGRRWWGGVNTVMASVPSHPRHSLFSPNGCFFYLFLMPAAGALSAQYTFCYKRESGINNRLPPVLFPSPATLQHQPCQLRSGSPSLAWLLLTDGQCLHQHLFSNAQWPA